MQSQSDGVTRLRVDVFGTEYTLRGRAPIEHLHWVAQKVDSVMRQISSGNVALDPKRIAVLAAINIADELHQLQLELEAIQRSANEGPNAADTPQQRSRPKSEG